MHRLMGRTAIGLAAVLTLAVTGCAEDNGGGGADTGDPTLELTSSVEVLNSESFKMDMSMGDLMTATGAMDAASGAGEMSMSIGGAQMGMTMDMEIVFEHPDMWMNMGELGAQMGLETSWVHLDLSQVGGDGFMGITPGEGDLANTAGMLEGMVEVEKVDDRTFEGEIDMAKASGSMPGGDMPDDMGTVPFTATLDDEDRLTHMSLTIPEMQGMPEQTMDVRYYDFGAPVEITPPPEDEVTEMPAEMYESFQQMQ